MLGTPLHGVANTKIAQVLLDNGANVNAKDNLGNTPLLVAADDNSRGRPADMIKFLIQNGADVNAKDSKGRTALQLAADKGKVEDVKELIKNGADVTIKDKNSKTIFDYKDGNGKSLLDMAKESFESERKSNPSSSYTQKSEETLRVLEDAEKKVKQSVLKDAHAQIGEGDKKLLASIDLGNSASTSFSSVPKVLGNKAVQVG